MNSGIVHGGRWGEGVHSHCGIVHSGCTVVMQSGIMHSGRGGKGVHSGIVHLEDKLSLLSCPDGDTVSRPSSHLTMQTS